MNLDFYVNFLLSALFGAMLINGFFNVTRGSIKIMPDGSVQKEGMLFRDWYLFWYKEKKNIRIWDYKGEQFQGMLNKWQQSAHIFGIVKYYDDHIVVQSLPDKQTMDLVAMTLGIVVFSYPTPATEPEQGIEIYFRQKEKLYVFPWWVRKMMAGCIPCLSSWLGSIIYWAQYFLLNHANSSMFLVILTWIAYCISLAFLSPYLWKKING